MTKGLLTFMGVLILAFVIAMVAAGLAGEDPQRRAEEDAYQPPAGDYRQLIKRSDGSTYFYRAVAKASACREPAQNPLAVADCLAYWKLTGKTR